MLVADPPAALPPSPSSLLSFRCTSVTSHQCPRLVSTSAVARHRSEPPSSASSALTLSFIFSLHAVGGLLASGFLTLGPMGPINTWRAYPLQFCSVIDAELTLPATGHIFLWESVITIGLGIIMIFL